MLPTELCWKSQLRKGDGEKKQSLMCVLSALQTARNLMPNRSRPAHKKQPTCHSWGPTAFLLTVPGLRAPQELEEQLMERHSFC